MGYSDVRGGQGRMAYGIHRRCGWGQGRLHLVFHCSARCDPEDG